MISPLCVRFARLGVCRDTRPCGQIATCCLFFYVVPCSSVAFFRGAWPRSHAYARFGHMQIIRLCGVCSFRTILFMAGIRNPNIESKYRVFRKPPRKTCTCHRVCVPRPLNPRHLNSLLTFHNKSLNCIHQNNKQNSLMANPDSVIAFVLNETRISRASPRDG